MLYVARFLVLILTYPLLLILRITTALVFIILFSITLLKYMSDGPIWNQILEASIINNCEENWWISLIYAQNYLSPMKRVSFFESQPPKTN